MAHLGYPRANLSDVDAEGITAEQRARLFAALSAVPPAPEQLRRIRSLAKSAYAPLPERAKAALERRRAAS